MAKLTLFDVLGVAGEADPLAAAVSKFPRSRIQGAVGHIAGAGGGDDPSALIQYLLSALEFRAVRPAAAADSVGLTAEVIVANPPEPEIRPLVLTQMPDVAFRLRNTPGVPGASGYRPARVFATQADTGVELVVEALPVEIRLPPGLLEPLRSEEEDEQYPAGGPDQTFTNAFVEGQYDSLQVTLRDTGETSIFVHVRVRMTEELDFVVEPAVPISVGPCRFSGLPCMGVHDIGLVPAPVLSGDHSANEQALEWTRHALDRMEVDSDYPGALTVRTLDLDPTASPLEDLNKFMNEGRTNEARVEFVLEDLAIPFFGSSLMPVPSHGLFGLRRRIEAGDDPVEAFGFAGSPVAIKLGDWGLVIEQLLLRTPAKVSPAPDQFIFLQMALLFGSTNDAQHALTFGVSDEWTLQAGYRHGTGLKLFTIADATLSLWGARVGWSIQRFASKSPRYEWQDQLQLLVDLGLSSKATTFGETAFKIRSLSGKELQIVLRDIGWNLGEMSFSGIAFPEGAQFIFADVVRLIVEEMGWVTENSGARYFSFTGGVTIFSAEASANRSPSAGAGSAAINDQKGNGGGIRFLRLRFRTGGNASAAPWLLDGISANLKWGTFTITGFGMVSEFTLDGNRYKELGFGIQVGFEAIAKKFLIGMQFFHGSVRGASQNFKYWMFGFQFSPIPIGAVELVNIRFLLTGNMVPNLPAPDGHEQNMRLFRWYRNTGNAAITLPTNRKAAGWARQDDSFAFGAGLGLTLSVGKIITIDVFVFYQKSPAERGLMIALEVFMLKGDDPVGYGVLEFDFARDKWGFLLGVSLTLENIVGFRVPVIGELVSLTGTLYAGNKPATFAIGQLNDQATWLSLKSDVDAFISVHLLIGLCVQVVDAPAGPRGFGFVVAAKGGASFGIGKIQVYASLGFIAGIWRNESTECGFIIWIEAGVRIKIFWIFHFGASVKIEFTYLGGEPPYRRLGVEFRIDTPWFMPDITFRFEKVWHSPDAAAVETISTPILSAGAVELGSRTQIDTGVTPLTGASIDPKAVYSLKQLRTFNAPGLASLDFDGLTPVSVDSVIAVDFKPPVDDELSVGENTPAGAGTQRVNDLSATHELITVSILRRPRFGAGAGVWSELVAAEETTLVDPADFPPGFDVAALYSSTVRFQWDRDLLKENELDPRRLLINAETPFTFVTSNPEGDETHVQSGGGWPCCDPKSSKEPAWHQLDFMETPFGVRAPSSQRFTNSESRLHWTMPRAPLVVPTAFQASPWHVARVRLPNLRAGAFATVTLDERASELDIFIQWRPQHTHETLVIDTLDGVDTVHQATYTLQSGNPPEPIHIERPHGFTSVRLSYSPGNGHGEPIDPDGAGFVEISRMRYRTVAESNDHFHDRQKCKARNAALSGSGKLAWLPNHDYAITLTTRVTVRHEQTAAGDAEVRQRVSFRTKGLPGLNAVARIGDELEPYAESTYPGAAPRVVYRTEAINIAFNERFNSLLPVDRAPSPDNPDERNQILEWVLAVEHVGSATTRERLTKTSADWIVSHRASPPPTSVVMKGVVDDVLVMPLVRKMRTRDPLSQRFEILLTGVAACQSTPPKLHNSQVLVHQPVDPAADASAPQRWRPRSSFRANVRRKNAPFVERVPFHAQDSTAFDSAHDAGGTPPGWSSANGVMHPLGAANPSSNRYAVFGESTWNHVQIRVAVDPQGAAAGVAVAVSGGTTVSRALVALVDEGARHVAIVRREAGGSTTLGTVPLGSGASPPYALEVWAFDDKLRAGVGEAVVEADRGPLREGRLALVARGGGSFGGVVVEALDAYRFHFDTSRFVDFEDHIGSFDGTVPELPPGAAGGAPSGSTASTLLAAPETGSSRISEVMTGADPEERQRLFDRWTAELDLLLLSDVEGLHISRSTDGSGSTTVFILESPEPLPFTEDVSVTLEKRVLVPTGCLTRLGALLGPVLTPARRFLDVLGGRRPEQRVSDVLARFGKQLHFTGDRVRGVVPRGALGELAGAPRRVVRAVDDSGTRRLEAYDVKLRASASPDHMVLAGARVALVGSTAKAVELLREGELALTDERGHVLGPFVPTTTAVFVEVHLTVLSNGDETKTLLIPTTAGGGSAPQSGGTYRMKLELDRARFRADSPDDVSNYRAEATLGFSW